MAKTGGSRPARDRELAAAIDVGASKTVCLIAHLVPSADGALTAEIVGAGRSGGPLRERGPRADAAEIALRSAVEAAERMAGERVRSVFAGVAGRSLSCRRVGVALDLDGGRVAAEDVDECLRQGSAAAAADGAIPLHATPVSWALDGEDAGARPTGLAGAALTAEIFGVAVRESHLINLEALAGRAGLAVERAFAAPYAAARAVLDEDEMDLGVVMLDIGASSTGYALFERGSLAGCGGVPLGGDHITRDLAKIFGAPLAKAERVKTLHGAAISGIGDEHKLIDFPQIGEVSDIVRVSRAEVSAVITPRLEEIFELTLARLSDAALGRRGVRRAVLTGGGSLLVGARETAERVLAMKARLGRPHGLAGAPDAATSPQFAVCAGLIELAAQSRMEKRKPHGTGAYPIRDAGGVAASVGRWLRDNF